MKKKAIISITIILVSLLFSVGCSSQSNNLKALQGKWQLNDIYVNSAATEGPQKIIEFTNDKYIETTITNTEEGKDSEEVTIEYSFKYTEEGKMEIEKDGNKITYTFNRNFENNLLHIYSKVTTDDGENIVHEVYKKQKN